MKQFLILALTLLTLQGSSQNIIDLFISAPDSSILNLNKETRKKIAKVSADNKSKKDAIEDLKAKDINHAFDIVDKTNGYLQLIGGIEGKLNMCMWNLKNKNKFVAIYIESCGPVCGVDRLDFYEYDGKKFIPKKFSDVIPEIYNDFLKENPQKQIEKMKKKEIIATLLYELPRYGKNMLAKWGNEEGAEIYKPYAKGNRMILVWKDGKFTKGRLYTSTD